MTRVALTLVCLAVASGFGDAALAEEGIWECVVHADEGWQSCDVMMRRGNAYLVTAVGLWTTSDGSKYPTTTPMFGPDGGGQTAGASKILPIPLFDFRVNRNFELGCLMAAVGASEFEVGSLAVIKPDLSGRLRLCMNDKEPRDNDGKVQVTIELITEKDILIYEKAFKVRPNLGKDDPNSGWQRSGIRLSRGDSVTLAFYGKWTTQPLTTGVFGPEGGGISNADKFRLIPDPNVKIGALLGRIGYTGRPFAVNPKGERKVTFTADDTGDLFFNINDTFQVDNAGTIVVVPLPD